MKIILIDFFFITYHFQNNSATNPPCVPSRLEAEVSPEWRLNPSFETQKKCPFPLNRGVLSIEVTEERLCELFPGTNLVSPEWRCPEGKVSLYALIKCYLIVT